MYWHFVTKWRLLGQSSESSFSRRPLLLSKTRQKNGILIYIRLAGKADMFSVLYKFFAKWPNYKKRQNFFTGKVSKMKKAPDVNFKWIRAIVYECHHCRVDFLKILDWLNHLSESFPYFNIYAVIRWRDELNKSETIKIGTVFLS